MRYLAGPSSILTSKAFYNLTPGLSPNSFLGSYGGTAQPTTTTTTKPPASFSV